MGEPKGTKGAADGMVPVSEQAPRKTAVKLFNPTHADILVTAKDGQQTITIGAKSRVTLGEDDVNEEVRQHLSRGTLERE